MVKTVQNGRSADPRTVAENIIAEYGKSAFRDLIEMFCQNESGTKIGYVFEVSRQRVHQWKRALGYEEVTYTVKAEIADLVSKKTKVTQRTAV